MGRLHSFLSLFPMLPGVLHPTAQHLQKSEISGSGVTFASFSRRNADGDIAQAQREIDPSGPAQSQNRLLHVQVCLPPALCPRKSNHCFIDQDGSNVTRQGHPASAAPNPDMFAKAIPRLPNGFPWWLPLLFGPVLFPQ
jgi:hypothetical protein